LKAKLKITIITAMISVTELRAGKHFQIDGQPYQVIEYKHSKVGRGNASIKLKIRNLRTQAVIDKTYISGASVEPINTTTKIGQFLYRENQAYIFMDPKTFEQFEIQERIVKDQGRYLKEGEEVKLLFWEDEPLSIELPTFMVYQIKQTDPGVKGDTVSAVYKPAITDNNLVIKVPLFIKIGDLIKVDTRSGNYLERAK
jgi:elongation factor P